MDQELLTLFEHLGSSTDFGGVGVAHLFSFSLLCCLSVLVYFVLCLVSDASVVSGLLILDISLLVHSGVERILYLVAGFSRLFICDYTFGIL